MDNTGKQKYLRQIPSISELLEKPFCKHLLILHPRWIVLKAIRASLNKIREKIVKSIDTNLETILKDEINLENIITSELKFLTQNSLRKVINATGVVIHTNLGRAPLGKKVLENLKDIALNYSNLEYNVKSGRRESRYFHVENLLCDITGAEASVVVNNNAAAVFIALNVLAKGKEVIVSRGELIEIGGSFRIPDIMRRSGAILVEVGTTNKTNLKDYVEAISDKTALLLKVHTSNFKVLGFVSQVNSEELVKLGKTHHIPVMEDLGSGCLIDLSKFGLPKEPTVQETIKDGIDIVTFSGDKLLGGPQAGIILGKKEIINSIRNNPLSRIIRVDKLTLSGIEATLRIYKDEGSILENIPVLKMLMTPEKEIKRRAKRLYNKLKNLNLGNVNIGIIKESSLPGGGALPLLNLPTYVLYLEPKNTLLERIEELLHLNNPPIITRIKDDKIYLDLRTVNSKEIYQIVDAVRRIFS